MHPSSAGSPATRFPTRLYRAVAVLVAVFVAVSCEGAYVISRVAPNEIRASASFICRIFQEEGYFESDPAVLAQHTDETEVLLTDNIVKFPSKVPGFHCAVFKAQRNDKFVGLAQVLTDNSSPRRAVLQNLGVSRAYRRLGLGKLLVDACEKAVASEFSGESQLWLNVEDDNDAAISFYLSLGYVSADGDSGGGFGSRMFVKKLA